jgi:methylmalonyl-CoA/ethylmalonyl-CoA epimerase
MKLPLPKRIETLGSITQIAYVPKDFDAALRFWTERVGVGPFFCVEHVPVEETIYRGLPTRVDISLAVSQWGDVQIELIRQNDRAASIYRDWNSDTMHHIQVAVPDYAAAAKLCEERGFPLAMECRGAPGAPDFRVGFFDLGDCAPAGFLELAYFPDPGGWRAMVERIKCQVSSWDGQEPVRPFDKL